MENFNYYLKEVGEYGVVIDVRGSIVIIEGLPGAKMHEMILFEEGALGTIISVERSVCKTVILSGAIPEADERVARTNKEMEIPIDESIIGKMVNPLCEGCTGTLYSLTGILEGIGARAKIDTQFRTGIALIDLLIPLGAGQKELIIGNRKTGKTNVVLTTVKNQILEGKGKIVILALIGKRKSDIQKINHFLHTEKLDSHVILVVSAADDPDYLVYLTPYSAMTIAEFFKARGQDTIVILDDLTTHAKVYRQMSLLSGRFPGRESYPDDMFYVHARLLERAGNFRNAQGRNISITCLPIAESVGGDFSGHITTNLMGITDGHIFFDSALFEKGKRPAINPFLSVTRVGRQTQSFLAKDINQKITTCLAEYESLQNLAHFGAELSSELQDKLKKGKRLNAIFEQDFNMVFDKTTQLILIGIVWGSMFEELSVREIQKKLTNQYALLTDICRPEKIQFFESLEQLVNELQGQKEAIAKILL